jgi:hypothetical protein
MRRRGFIKSLAGLGAFMILPGAGRVWKATRPELIWQTTDGGVRAELMKCWSQTERFSVCYDEAYWAALLEQVWRAPGGA